MPSSVVLLSGGLDSAVLLAREVECAADARVGDAGPPDVWPVHVRVGLVWEAAEARAIDRLLALPPFAGRTKPVTSCGIDLCDVYPPTHWAVAGKPPASDTPDRDVFLEGRNVVLAVRAALLCARLGAQRLVIGPLAGNPFPDTSARFFEAMGKALSLGLDRPIQIAAPFASLRKDDVITLGVRLAVPLGETLSCMNPSGDRHCGNCSKCRERRDGFRAAGVRDEAVYVPE